ncbi:MAG: hypothetical protein ACXAEU_06050 [Candidatus Hodarchaeales archaeon]|jgi:hypothetical protein
MDLKIADLIFDATMFFSSLFALIIAIVLGVSILLFETAISLHLILEAAVLAFFGGWGLLQWYREVI